MRRISEHREGVADGFTRRHRVKCLVHFEMHEDIEEAIKREKSLKCWRRAWKIALIEGESPQWTDLWGGLSR